MSKSEPVAPNAAQFLIIGERTNITDDQKLHNIRHNQFKLTHKNTINSKPLKRNT